MRKRRVAIVYANPLFARGIACLLDADPRVEVASVEAVRPDLDGALRSFHPEVVIVEQDGQGPARRITTVGATDQEPRPLLIFLGLKDTGMELFYNRRVTEATPDNLLEIVLEGQETRRGGSRREPEGPGSAGGLTVEKKGAMEVGW